MLQHQTGPEGGAGEESSAALSRISRCVQRAGPNRHRPDRRQSPPRMRRTPDRFAPGSHPTGSRSRHPARVRRDENRLPARGTNAALGSPSEQDIAEPIALQRRPQKPRQLRRLDMRRPRFADTQPCPRGLSRAVQYSLQTALLIQDIPGTSQFIPMVLKEIPSRRRRRGSRQDSPLFEIDHARSVGPVHMAVSPVVAVPSFIIDVNPNSATLDHLDHKGTVPRSFGGVNRSMHLISCTIRYQRLLQAVVQDVHVLQRQPGADRGAGEGSSLAATVGIRPSTGRRRPPPLREPARSHQV